MVGCRRNCPNGTKYRAGSFGAASCSSFISCRLVFATPAITNFLYPAFTNPTEVALQLFGGAQGGYGMVALGQGAVGQEAVHAAVAGLAQVHGFAVAATFFAGHQVVAAGVLHGALAEAAARVGGSLGAGSGFGGGLGKLLAASHGVSGGIRVRRRLTIIFFRTKELRSVTLAPYIDHRLASFLIITFLQGFHLFFLSFFL
jgi:hypothetical protein